MITIRHTHETGTLIEGSSRGDGVYEIVRKRGFRYFPSIEQIGIQGSRDKVAKRWKINDAASALRAAGHEVEVVIDDEHRDRATVLADQAGRLDERRDRLEASAAKHAAASDAAYEASNRLIEHIPPGQPILVGHHSERSHRRTLDRSWNLMGKSVREGEEAKRRTQQAEAVGSQTPSDEPSAIRRRIERAETEVRDLSRKIDGFSRNSLNGKGAVVYVETHKPASGQYEESLRARRGQLYDQLAHDRMLLARAVEEGRYTPWDRTTVHVGDLVSTRSSGGYRAVIKVNKVTVACATGYSWTDKIPFSALRRVHCPHAMPEDTSADPDCPVTPDTQPPAEAGLTA